METENYWTKVNTQGLEEIICPGSVIEKPPTNTEYLRLYNNPICPFAERARITLALRGFQFQLAQVSNNEKPPYFEEWGGTVPVLEKPDGTILNDSNDIIAFANEEGTGPSLVPTDEKEREKQERSFKELFNGYVPIFFGALGSQKEDAIKALLERYQLFEDNLAKNTDGNKFFNNSPEVSITDVLLQGFVSRTFYAFEEKIIREGFFDKSNFPNIEEFVKEIEGHPVISTLAAPKIPTLNHALNGVKARKYVNLPYPIDYTPLEDSQGLKKLYILNGHTAKPRTNDNYMRLYAHPLCPFAERACLAIAAKGIPHQFVGVDLTEKNRWHLDINKGLIPFVELPSGEFVTESLGVADWAQEYTTEGLNLYPGDGDNKKKIKDLISSTSSTLINIVVSFIKYENIEGDGPKTFVDSIYDFSEELEKSSNDFLLDQEHEKMADLVTFSFLHREFLIEGSVLKEQYYDQIDFSKITKLKGWYDNLAKKYEDVIGQKIDFAEQARKNIEAAGPKVQLHYPIPSES